MNIEINCNIELAEILLYLADRQERTAQVLDNTFYTSKINKYFAKYKSHAAVIMTQKLIDQQNFIHIKPIRAILSLDNILADNTHHLHEWANIVSDFAKQTNYDVFFDSMQDYYRMILDKIKGINIEKCISYTRNYFKSNNDNFCLFICPFAGNYGFVLDDICYVVRCLPYDEDGNINPVYTNRLIGGIAHEYAHCFVNPVIEKYKNNLVDYKDFFSAHKSMYSAYNVDYAVMNEYFARTYTMRYRDLFKNDFPDYDEYLKAANVANNPFVFCNEFYEFLLKYEKSSLSFEEFYLKNSHIIGGLK